MTQELTREEFNEAISAALTSVRGLYRESTLLMKEITGLLSEGEESLDGLVRAQDKQKKNAGEILPDWMGRIVWSTEDGDDANEEAESETDEEETESSSRKHLKLSGDPLVFIKVILREPGREAFEPHVIYGVLIDPRVGNEALGDGFSITSGQLRRVLRPLKVTSTSVLQTKAAIASGGRAKKSRSIPKLAFSLAEPPRSRAFYDIRGPDDALAIADEIRAMWAAASGRSELRAN